MDSVMFGGLRDEAERACLETFQAIGVRSENEERMSVTESLRFTYDDYAL